MPADQAKQEYIDLVSSLSTGWQEQKKEKSGGGGGPGGPVFSSLVDCMEESEAGPVSGWT